MPFRPFPFSPDQQLRKRKLKSIGTYVEFNRDGLIERGMKHKSYSLIERSCNCSVTRVIIAPAYSIDQLNAIIELPLDSFSIDGIITAQVQFIDRIDRLSKNQRTHLE